MTKEFIPYQQAFALKKLGFDEPCFGKFDYTELEVGGKWSNSLFKNVTEDIFTAAPTYSQAFRWFREKYEYYYYIFPLQITASDKTGYRYSWEIYSHTPEWITEDRSLLGSLTYEEAELECLKKLIQICLEQQKATKTGSLNAQAYVGEKL